MTDKAGVKHAIAEVLEVRDLGVMVSKNLTTAKHVDTATNSANRALFSIKRGLYHLNKSTGPYLYKSLVRPILEYGNSAWHPQSVNEIEKLEKIQRRATRWICRDKNLDYEGRLRKLKLPTLTYRRKRGDLIEIFKYFLKPSTYNSLHLKISTQPTRGHCKKIIKGRYNTRLRGNFLSQSVINDWNSLPEHLVKVKTVEAFKNGLDREWAAKPFLYNYRG